MRKLFLSVTLVTALSGFGATAAMADKPAFCPFQPGNPANRHPAEHSPTQPDGRDPAQDRRVALGSVQGQHRTDAQLSEIGKCAGQVKIRVLPKSESD